MTAHGAHRSYMLDMAHSIPSVDQAKSRQAPWPAEHTSPRLMRVALVTLKVVPAVQPACHGMFDRPPTNQYPQREYEAHQDDPALPNATGNPENRRHPHGRCRRQALHPMLRIVMNDHPRPQKPNTRD